MHHTHMLLAALAGHLLLLAYMEVCVLEVFHCKMLEALAISFHTTVTFRTNHNLLRLHFLTQVLL